MSFPTDIYPIIYATRAAAFALRALAKPIEGSLTSLETPSLLAKSEEKWQRYQLKKIIKEYSKYYKKLEMFLKIKIIPELSDIIMDIL